MTPERYARLERLLDSVADLPPGERGPRLAALCADDPSLVTDAERLMALAADDAFLSGTAFDDAARDLAAVPDALVGRRVGHYEIRARLGGGMSDVYDAYDTKLYRDVVVKVLPPTLAGANDRTRFDREARTLSSLNHPHIVPIHDLGDVDGRAFLVTARVDGQTLRAMLADGPLPAGTAVSIARQIALALDASHRAGVLHRDVKPENVVVRPDGVAVLIDFGLARVAGPAGADGVTAAGVVLGTPGYMSPEQIRGAALDERSDVFALGAVLYEMLAGQRPFGGDTPADGLAATLTGDTPALPPTAPPAAPALARLVAKTLAKSPGDRFPSAYAVIDALDRIDVTAAPAAAFRGAGRRGTRAVAVLAVVLAAAIGGALLVMDRTPTTSALTERDTLLLGPFVNSTSEQVFDASLRRALGGQLEQSPFLALADDDRVGTVLRSMKLPPDGPLTAERAREVCLRSGIKAYVAGAIDRSGRGYMVTLHATAAATGAAIASAQAEAPSRDLVLEALRSAAVDLRTQLGETLASVQRFGPPIDQVTTASLEALRSYALGREAMARGNSAKAIALLARAVEIDVDFPVAWAQLSAAYGNVGNDPRAADAASRAYDGRDAVSERERLYITQHYARFVEGDLDRSIASLELARTLYPRDVAARVNLASHFLLIGRPADALVEADEARALNPDNVTAYTNAATALLVQERGGEARTRLDAAAARGLVAAPHPLGNALDFVGGDARSTFDRPAAVAGTPREPEALNAAAAAAAVLGQWPRAAILTRHAIDRATRIDATLAARFAFEGSIRAAAFERCAEARGLADETTRLTTQAWFLSGAALALALCGDAAAAERLIARVLALRPRDTLVVMAGAPTVRALNALTRRDPGAALTALEHVAPYDAGLYAGRWPAFVRGRALLAAARPAEAVRELTAVVGHRGQLLAGTFTPPLPLVELTLARAQAAAGDGDSARTTYERVVASWSTATADLPQLAQARAEQQRLR